jgi:hypothetical protein
MLADLLSQKIDSEKNHVTKKDHYRKEWTDPAEKLVRFFLDAILSEIILLSKYERTVNTSLEIPLLDEVMSFIDKNPDYLNDDLSLLNYHLIRIQMYFDGES